MSCRYCLQVECAHSVDRVGNDLLRASRQMEPSHYAVKHLTREGIPGMSQPIHDTSMGTCSEHEYTLVLQSHGDEALISDQGIRLPTRTILGAPIVVRQSCLELCDSRYLAADEEEVLQDELRFSGVEHACPLLFEPGPTRNIVKQMHRPVGRPRCAGPVHPRGHVPRDLATAIVHL